MPSLRFLVVCFFLILQAGCATTKTIEDDRTFESYVNLGISYISQNNLASASNALAQASKIDNDDYRLNHAYALLAQFKGDARLADKLYKDVLDEQPNFSRARNNYGVFLGSSEREPEAIEHLTMAAEDRTYDRREIAYENLSEVALKINQPTQAIAALKNARAVNPIPRFSLRLAELHAQQDKFKLSLEYFREYLDLVYKKGGKPASQDMQVGIVAANRVGNGELEEEYRVRKAVLEELENSS